MSRLLGISHRHIWGLALPLFLSCMIFYTGCQQKQPPEKQSPAEQSVIRFQRANFVVADIDRALTFYRDVLGFSVGFVGDSSPDSYSYDVFEIEKGTPVRFAVLSSPTQVRVMALTEVKGIASVVQGPRRSAIVLEVLNFDEIVSSSKALGLKVHIEEELITKDGRKGREIGIVDFDGNLVVIYLITGRVEE